MSSPPPAFATAAHASIPGLTHGAGHRSASRPNHPQVGFAPAKARHAAPPLALQRVAKDAVLITLLLLLNVFGNVGAGVFFAILVVMTFRSPESAFKALVIMWLGLMCNNLLVPKSLVWTPCRLVLPFLSFARFSSDLIALKTSLFSKTFYGAFVVYCFVMAVCSIVSGWYTTIALFKLVNFWVTFSAVFAGATVLVRRRFDPGAWLVSMIVSATMIGVIAVAISGGMVSVHRDTNVATHFGGAFLHPNCHSSYGSMFVLTLVMVYAFTRYRHRWVVVPMIAVWLLFMVWSKSRTSFVATGLGLMTLLPLLSTSLRRTLIRRVNISRTGALAAGVVALAVLVIVNVVTGNAIGESLIVFINKSSQLSDTGDLAFNVESAVFSRVGKMEESMANFRESPVFGIGFQVMKSEFFIRNATLFTAPAEKGFLPTAVLEEGGVVGAFFFVVFIASLVGTFIVERNAPALVMFMTYMGSTMTEVTIFSPGGSGGFGWIMVAAAYVFGEMTWVRRRAPGGATPHRVTDFARPGIRGMAPLPVGLPSPG